MGRTHRSAMASLSAGIASAALLLACGGGGGSTPANNCPNFAGNYSVTTEIVSTTCPAVLDRVTDATWKFTQAAPSCAFTMTDTTYSGSVYSGHFAMSGTDATVSFDSVSPAPTPGGYTLTYVSESLTIYPAVAPASSTISGSFVFHSAYPCDGTTNVCHGTVAACLTPQ